MKNDKSRFAMAYLILFAITFSSNMTAQEQIAANDWKLIKEKTKGEGWKIYKRKVPDTKLHEVKMITKINCSYEEAQAKIFSMFINPEFYISDKGKPMGTFKILDSTANELTLYSYMYGPGPVKDRDVVVRYTLYEDTILNVKGVKWHHIEKEGYEPTDTIIRMPVDIGNWRFEKIDSSSCMATNTLRFDPGGNPPYMIINMIVKWVLPNEIKHFKAYIKEED